LAKYGTTVEVNLKTQLDQSGLTQLMQSLKNVEAQVLKSTTPNNKGFQETLTMVEKLRALLNSSFDVELGVFNVQKFNTELSKSDLSIRKIHQDLDRLGPAGQKAFSDFTYQTLKMNTGIRQSNELLDKMATTMGNTVRWGITAGIFQGITAEIGKAFNYVVQLDTALNNIGIVTFKSKDDMKDFAQYANNAAKAIGSTTVEYTKAAQFFYEQGLKDKDVLPRAAIAIKAANVSHEDSGLAAEQLTAVWNAYNVQTKDAAGYIDVMAAVATDSATDLNELATSMGKVASTASMMGVNINQLSAQIATIESVTRQSPEIVGTALKTIYARMGDLKVVGAVDEFGVSLGKIGKDMQAMGVNILDEKGQMRDMGLIIEEVSGKWQGWTRAQQEAAAVSLAGKRQYNNLIALFDNEDMYKKELGVAEGALGTLDKQNAIYMDSAEAHMKKLQTASEKLYSSIFDTDSIIGATDAATTFLGVLTNMFQAAGGGIPMFMGLASVLAKVFSVQLSQSIAGMVRNMRLMATEAKQASAINQMQMQYANVDWSKKEVGSGGAFGNGTAAYRMIEVTKELAPYLENMTAQQREQYDLILKQVKALGEERDQLRALSEARAAEYNKTFGKSPNAGQFGNIQTGENGLFKSNGTLPAILSPDADKSKQALGSLGAAADLVNLDVKSVSDNIQNLYKSVESGDKDTKSFNNLKKALENLIVDGKDANISVKALEDRLVELNGMTAKSFQGNEGRKFLGQTTFMASQAGIEVQRRSDLAQEIVAQQQRVRDSQSANAPVEVATKGSQERLLSTAKTQQSIQKFTELAGTIGQVGFAISSVSNLGTIWQDKNASIADQLGQTLFSLSMIIPGVISGYQMLYNVVASGEALQNLGLVKQLAGLATKQTALAAEIVAIKAKSALTIQTAAEELIATEMTTAERGKAIAAISGEVVATETLAIAQAEEAAAATAAAAANAAATAGITLIVAALAAMVAGLVGVAKAQAKQREESMKAATAAKEAYIQNKDLYDQFQIALTANKEGTGTYQAVLDASKALNNSLQDQGAITSANAQRWDEYGVSATKALKKQLEDSIKAASTGVTSALDSADSKQARGVLDSSKPTTGGVYGFRMRRAPEDLYAEYLSKKAQYKKDLDTLGSENPAVKKEAEDIAKLDAVYAATEVQMQNIIDLKKEMYNFENSNKMLASTKELNNEVAKLAHAMETGPDGKRNNVPAEKAEKAARDYLLQSHANATLATSQANQANLTSNFTEKGKGISQSQVEGFVQKLGGDKQFNAIISMYPEEDKPKTLENITKFKDKISKENPAKIKIIAEGIAATPEAAAYETVSDSLAKGSLTAVGLNKALKDINPTLAKMDPSSVKFFFALKDAQEKAIQTTLKMDKTNKNSNAIRQDQLDLLEINANREEQVAKSKADVIAAETNLKDVIKKSGASSERAALAEKQLEAARAKSKATILAYRTAVIKTGLEELNLGSYASWVAKIISKGHEGAIAKLAALRSELGKLQGAYAAVAAAALTAYEQGGNARDYVNNTSNSKAAADLASTQDRIKALTAALTVKIDIPSASSASTAKSGSGSGSKTKAKANLNKMEQIASEFDPYYNINKTIAELVVNFDKLSEAQKKLIGSGLISNLNKQLDIIAKQVKAEKDKYELQKLNEKQLQKSLAKEGLKFDKEGNISNYESRIKAAEKKVEVEIDRYNKLKTEKAQKAEEKKEKAAENALTKLKDEISNYDQLTQTDMKDTLQKISDFQAKATEITIQKFSVSIDVSTNFAEAERKWNEFRAVVINDLDMDKAINKLGVSIADLSTYFNAVGDANLDKLTAQLNTVNEEVTKIQNGKNSSLFGDDLSAATDMRDSLLTQLEDGLTSYKTLIDDVKKSTIDWVSQSAESFGEVSSQFDYINSSLKHQSSLMKLLYGDKAYSEMDDFYQAQEVNNNAQAVFLENQLKVLTNTRDSINKITNPDLWDTLNLKVEDTQKSLDSLVETSMDNLTTKYTNSINQILDTFANKLTNGAGLEKVSEEWTMINKNAAVYLDTVTAGYSINQLQSKMVENINNAKDVSSQKQLTDIMNAQLKALREKDVLTQRDLDRANQSYDIELKRIALEDAQNNKTKMQLQRNAQGNYSYVYAADQKQLTKARQDLADAQKAQYDSDKKAFEESQTNYQETFKQYTDKAKEIALDTTSTEAEKQASRVALDTQYGALLQKQTQINETSKQNYAQSTMDQYASLYGKDSEEYKAFLDNKDVAMAASDSRWTSSLQGMIDSIEGEGGFKSVSSDLWTQLTTESTNYQGSIDKLQSSANVDFDDISDALIDATEQTTSLSKSGSDLVTTMESESIAIQDVVSQLNAYEIAMQKVIAASGKIVGTSIQTKATEAGSTTNVPNSAITSGVDTTAITGDTPKAGTTFDIPNFAVPTPTDSTKGDDGDTTSPEANKQVAKALSAAYSAVGKPYKWGAAGPDAFDCSGLDSWVLKKAGFNYGRFTTRTEAGLFSEGRGKKITLGLNPGHHTGIEIDGKWFEAPYKGANVRGPGKAKSSWPAYYHIPGFESGGYTGDDGDSGGKLAIVHNKEVILNKKDTVNLLSAVSIVRSIVDNLKAGAMASASSLVSSLSGNSGGAIGTTGILEQKVEITANFPNVTDSKQIQDALINLPNIAAQHATKK